MQNKEWMLNSHGSTYYIHLHIYFHNQNNFDPITIIHDRHDVVNENGRWMMRKKYHFPLHGLLKRYKSCYKSE